MNQFPEDSMWNELYGFIYVRCTPIPHFTDVFHSVESWYGDYAMDWMVWGSNCGRSKRFYSSCHCPDWLWGPPNLPFNVYLGSFLGGGRLSSPSMKLITQLHLEPRLRVSGTILLLPLHAFMVWRRQISCVSLPLTHSMKADYRAKICSSVAVWVCVNWPMCSSDLLYRLHIKAKIFNSGNGYIYIYI